MTDCFALESAKIHAVKTIVSLSPWSRSLVEPWSLHLPGNRDVQNLRRRSTATLCFRMEHQELVVRGSTYAVPAPERPVNISGPWPSGRKTFTRRKLETPEELQQRIELAYTAREVRCSPAYSHLVYSLATDVVPRM